MRTLIGRPTIRVLASRPPVPRMLTKLREAVIRSGLPCNPITFDPHLDAYKFTSDKSVQYIDPSNNIQSPKLRGWFTGLAKATDSELTSTKGVGKHRQVVLVQKSTRVSCRVLLDTGSDAGAIVFLSSVNPVEIDVGPSGKIPEIIFHATLNKRMTKFAGNRGPTWFALTVRESLLWSKSLWSVTTKATILECKYHGPKIASVEQTLAMAKEIWPDEKFSWPMFHYASGVYEETPEFIDLFIKRGFGAAYMLDNDPEFMEDRPDKTSTTLVVFDASRDVTITGKL